MDDEDFDYDYTKLIQQPSRPPLCDTELKALADGQLLRVDAYKIRQMAEEILVERKRKKEWDASWVPLETCDA